ncbi:MAG: adenine deaminase [Clostridium chrysemydis]|uniref:adenine deaminase n=1 Tax=Clostridium chrysemydis TaxID=2665504 RepID=UPI003F2EE526
MKNDMSLLKKRIEVAKKARKADTVIKNGKVLNVFTGEIKKGDIAISDGIIAGIGEYEGENIIDAKGKVIAPGFIDAHMHIESTMLTPKELSKVLISHGVTTVMADPHEISNVSGKKGIEYILEASKDLPVDVFVMLPSCVPSTEFENSGFKLYSEDLREFYKNDKVLGLAEFMDFSAIYGLKEDMLQKIVDAKSNNKIIDGHATGLTKEELNVYITAGIYADHECANEKEAKERLDLGMYLMIREGTAAKELKKLIGVVDEFNSRRCILVTDDKLPDDLIREGSVDYNVKLAIECGLNPVTAIQMVTLNAAEFFNLNGYGAIAPGYKANIVILDDLEKVKIDTVIKDGKCFVSDGKFKEESLKERDNIKVLEENLPKINMEKLNDDSLKINLKSDICNIIEIEPNSLITYKRKEKVDLKDLEFIPSVLKDQLKMAVIERHHKTGNIGLGIVKGFKFSEGAIATSVAHDSHNIVTVGTNDKDMILASLELEKMNGGIAIVKRGKVISKLPLPIGGLLSNKEYKEVLKELDTLNEALKEIGFKEEFDPFLTLSFLTLPVIPEIKLTDTGLFDFKRFSHISIEAE